MSQMVGALGSVLGQVPVVLRQLPLWLLGAILLLNFSALNRAAQEFLAQASRIQSLEASGLKLVFKDAARLSASLRHVSDMTPAKQAAAIAAVNRLSGLQVERLFSLIHGGTHCTYPKPDDHIRLFVALDYGLQRLGLIESAPNEAALKAEQGKPGDGRDDIGAPISCHTTKLTGLGFDAKTALLGILREGFDGTNEVRSGQ